MTPAKLVKQLAARWTAAESFQPYGHGRVIYATVDGTHDSTNAQLVLQNGIARFYIVRLQHRGYKFDTLTRQVQRTQCLSSLEGKDLSIAVAFPANASQPVLKQIAAFRIPGNCFIKLKVGTWHAEPYFDGQFVDFYNLEPSDTNINARETLDSGKNKLELEIAKPRGLR